MPRHAENQAFAELLCAIDDALAENDSAAVHDLIQACSPEFQAKLDHVLPALRILHSNTRWAA